MIYFHGVICVLKRLRSLQKNKYLRNSFNIVKYFSFKSTINFTLAVYMGFESNFEDQHS